MREVGGVADEGPYTVQTKNTVSQQQYFVASCLISDVGNARLFFFYLPAADVGKTYRFAPDYSTVIQLVSWSANF
jgi:hypothetical protein